MRGRVKDNSSVLLKISGRGLRRLALKGLTISRERANYPHSYPQNTWRLSGARYRALPLRAQRG